MRTYKVSPRALGRFEKFFAKNMRKRRIARALRKAAPRIILDLRAASAPIFYKGRYQKGWYYTIKTDALIVGNKAAHWIYVEGGRKPNNTMPPIPAIREWVIAKGMRADAAFPVARKIAKRGIKPRPVFYAPDMQKRMQKHVEAALIRYVDKVVISGSRV